MKIKLLVKTVHYKNLMTGISFKDAINEVYHKCGTFHEMLHQRNKTDNNFLRNLLDCAMLVHVFQNVKQNDQLKKDKELVTTLRARIIERWDAVCADED